MNNTSLRTQVILPRELRREIDNARVVSNESLAQYIRRATRNQLAAERRRHILLAKLADEVVGVSKARTTRAEVVAWQRVIRRDRS